MSLLITILKILTFLLTIHQSKPNPHPKYPCKPPYHNSYPFCNTSLPTHTRALSLLSHLTLPEKIQQLSNTAADIPRLAVPTYEWWSESLHGIAGNGPGVNFSGPIPTATSFPQVIVATAAFNRSLWRAVGAAVAVEARAMYNLGQAGLTFWAPNINVFRDPRWGRGQETPGEDPMVAAAYGIEFVKGFQGGDWGDSGEFWEKRVLDENGGSEDDEKLMLSACCKHFTAYDLENWGNFSRYSFNAVVSEQDLEDTYQPPFRSCIEQGKASCLMCSYNQVNGVPACAMKDLLEKARIDWGFKGYITSDCDAVATIYEYQNYVHSPEDAVALVLKAGVDINCGTYLLRHTQSAVDEGKLEEKDIDRALLNLFSVQLRLGLFDGDPIQGRFGKLGPRDVCSREHKALALEAAKQGIVLLKNDKKFLPWSKNSVASLAVIGPAANDTTKMGGGYTGIPCNPKSYFEGLKDYVRKASYATGCFDIACEYDSEFNEAVEIARKSDFVIVVGGLDLTQETEDRDRVSLLLPGKQMSLISSVAAASKRPIVLVLTGGGPLDVSFAERDPRIASILWVGYPGEAGAKALSQIIFGEFNPGGRLPMTWYPESFTKVPMNDMNMRPNRSRGYPGRTYRFYTGDRVYGFGHGLSYTKFSYKLSSTPSKLSLSGSIKSHSGTNILNQRAHGLDYVSIDDVASCDSLRFHIGVSIINEGDVDGSDVVMLFARTPKIFRGTPGKQLVGFRRVHVGRGGAIETSILVEPCEHLSVANARGERVLALGDHVLVLGDLEHSVAIQT